MNQMGSILCGAPLLLALSTGLAAAGPCTGQIADLERMASTTGAATGSTAGMPAATGGTLGQAGAGGQALPPSISSAKGIMPAPGSTLQAEANRQGQGMGQGIEGQSTAATTGSTSTAAPGGTGPQAGMAPSVSSTKAMTAGPTSAAGETPPPSGTITGGLATSAQDVRAQQQGQPTAAQQANQNLSAQQAGVSNPQFLTAINTARQLDLQGKESECMSALDEARRLMGAR